LRPRARLLGPTPVSAACPPAPHPRKPGSSPTETRFARPKGGRRSQSWDQAGDGQRGWSALPRPESTSRGGRRYREFGGTVESRRVLSGGVGPPTPTTPNVHLNPSQPILRRSRIASRIMSLRLGARLAGRLYYRGTTAYSIIDTIFPRSGKEIVSGQIIIEPI